MVTSIIVVASLKVRDIVTASRGLFKVSGISTQEQGMSGSVRTLLAILT